MPTLFALLMQACGLSQADAADFLAVRPDTVKSWCAGRRHPSDHVLSELALLAARIRAAADAALAVIDAGARERGLPTEVELGLASDDAEAQSMGWPCVAAHQTVLARIAAGAVAQGCRVRIMPRGSTIATAGAADAQDA